MKKNKRRQISEARLNAYNRKASADLCVSKWGLRTGSAAAFAVAAAALAAPDTALASIIYTTPDAFFSVAQPTSGANDGYFRLDVDGDGQNDLLFDGDFFVNGLKTAQMAGLYGAQITTGFSTTGAKVGPARVFKSGFINLNLGSLGGGSFVGFRFQPGAADHVDYGWLRVSFNGTGSGSDEVFVSQLAYDDSGAPITIGDQGPGPAPEPGTLSMFTGIGLLALGAAGRRELRRRGAARSC